MSTFPVALPGWDEQSIWGYDPGQHCLYAQLTRNGHDTGDDGPQIWLTPPGFRTLYVETLAREVARTTGVRLLDATRALGQRGEDELFVSG